MRQKQLFAEREVTKARIVEYATAMAKRYRSYTKRVWDTECCKWVSVRVTNSVIGELRAVVGRWYHVAFTNEDRSDLADDLHDCYMHGVERPICKMSRKELVDFIWERIVEPAMEESSNTTWDDILKDHVIWPADYDK